MADNLADFPIVVLENDDPELLGKIGLFDLLMPVASTGLVFTAAVPGTLFSWGAQFSEPVQYAANLRAASTLVQMGLIRGESLSFIRQALRISQPEMAEQFGVSLPTAVGWENNATVVPLNVWTGLAQRACVADGRALPSHFALCQDWRPRVIRVFPNVPARGTPQTSNQAPPHTQSPTGFPGAECYPPRCC